MRREKEYDQNSTHHNYGGGTIITVTCGSTVNLHVKISLLFI